MFADLLLLSIAGGSGFLAAVIREYFFIRMCLFLICVIIIGGLLTMGKMTAVNVVTYHYSGPKFSTFMGYSHYPSKMTVTFKNTSDRTIKVSAIRPEITDDKGHDIIANNSGNDAEFIIGPHQELAYTFDYQFSQEEPDGFALLDRSTEHDTIFYAQSADCEAGSGCKHDPKLDHY